MNLSVYFKSVLEQDTAAVVLCNLEHEIIYMNPAAKARYAKHSGAHSQSFSKSCYFPAGNSFSRSSFRIAVARCMVAAARRNSSSPSSVRIRR